MPSPSQPPSIAAVRVRASARLHLGFLDLNGGLGRRFGSLGLTLESPCTELTVRRAARFQASGPDSARALDYARRLARRLQLPGAAEIVVARAIPAHAGLGSGSQMALATGLALGRLYHQALTARQIALLLGRGARSGIGIGAFEQGGFLVDTGRGPQTTVPPLATRLAFPEDWRLLLVYDQARTGISGEREHQAFAALPEFPAERSAHLCRLVLMQLLPALIERDPATFGAALSELQKHIGEHFAPIQGGRYSSPAVAAALAWLHAHGAAGVGQSSWGPTGFALCPDEAAGQRLLGTVRQRWPELEFALCQARNAPGELRAEPAAGQARIAHPPLQTAQR